MSDDFGTLNVRRAERAREMEVLRQHYRRHRDALQRMIADAPTEALADDYRRLAQQIERSIAKLDDLGTNPIAPGAEDSALGRGRAAAPAPALETPPHGDAPGASAEPSMRPLRPGPVIGGTPEPPEVEVDGGGSRVLMILGAALVALVLIGWLIWRASGKGAESGAAETAALTETETATSLETAPPPPAAKPIVVSPPTQDYGVVRKGTRATRRFEISNQTGEPVTVQLTRSTCRCLYYDYNELVPPKGSVTAVVTIDGAKAPAGPMRELVIVASRRDPSVRGAIEVVAVVK